MENFVIGHKLNISKTRRSFKKIRKLLKGHRSLRRNKREVSALSMMYNYYHPFTYNTFTDE